MQLFLKRPLFTTLHTGESLILITTIVHRAQDSRPGATIPMQERRPNTAMIFMSQMSRLLEAISDGNRSVTDHSRVVTALQTRHCSIGYLFHARDSIA